MEEKDENLIKEPQGRKLTKAESIRIKQFALTAADLEEKGYKLHNLTVSTVKANVLGIVAGCVLALPFVLAFHFTTGLNHHIIKHVYLILCPLAMIHNGMLEIKGVKIPVLRPAGFQQILMRKVRRHRHVTNRHVLHLRSCSRMTDHSFQWYSSHKYWRIASA